MTEQRIKELRGIIRQAEAEIDEIKQWEMREAHARGLAQSPKWNAMTPAQQQHCAFMAFDPDNPDVPVD